jgi:uncharacterized damage-inducible protein DinB
MSEAERIADQLERSMSGPAWHGPSVFEIVADLSAEEARRRPIATAHSIAEIVLHTSAWMRVANRRLDGERTELHGAADWPRVDEGFDWNAALRQLRHEAAALGERVKGIPDVELDTLVHGSDRDYSRYALLHGVVQHNLYHAGQIALLKKALRSMTAPL